MEIVVLKMLFIATVSAQYGKHVFVPLSYPWLQAQQHCREHYTDLSPITQPWVEEGLKKASDENFEGKFWIGLYRNVTQWKWSGGGNASGIPWDDHEPDNYWKQWAGAICLHKCDWHGWHNKDFDEEQPFFCFNLIVVMHEWTWEEAMSECRRNHTALTSLVSETENLLALREIKDDPTTDRVWIGLRFLGDRWLWVNGDPLEYQAWSNGGDQDQQCPMQNRCGALNKDGLWENRDCEERLNFICY
ncbi:uncharacterized protein ACO6RY_19360 [Pungitius sinensis]